MFFLYVGVYKHTWCSRIEIPVAVEAHQEAFAVCVQSLKRMKNSQINLGDLLEFF
jgi:hypothetical protein